MFSCEYCEIFNKSFFLEHLWWLLLYFYISLKCKKTNVFREYRNGILAWGGSTLKSIIHQQWGTRYISGGNKCSFFGKFGVLCFLVSPVLRFSLLPYYRRNSRSCKHFREVLKVFSEIYFVKLFELLASPQAQHTEAVTQDFPSLPKLTENFLLGCAHFTSRKFS